MIDGMIHQHPVLKIYGADSKGNVYYLNKGQCIIKAKINRNGYDMVAISKDGRHKQKMVHQMVYECINGVVPSYSASTADGLVINHINEIKSDRESRTDN